MELFALLAICGRILKWNDFQGVIFGVHIEQVGIYRKLVK